LERAFRLHENGASFYEKLILLDGGTIALSLTFLGVLIAHTPDGHLPKQPFLWLVCPAWVLLLISICCCWYRIVSFHNLNGTLLQQMCALSSGFYLQYLGIVADRVSVAMHGELRLGQETVDLSQFFSQISAAFRKMASDENSKYDALVLKAIEYGQKPSHPARIAMLSTTLAFVLLCTFAVKTLLSI
jgi:hypothetical protein